MAVVVYLIPGGVMEMKTVLMLVMKKTVLLLTAAMVEFHVLMASNVSLNIGNAMVVKIVMMEVMREIVM